MNYVTPTKTSASVGRHEIWMNTDTTSVKDIKGMDYKCMEPRLGESLQVARDGFN